MVPEYLIYDDAWRLRRFEDKRVIQNGVIKERLYRINSNKIKYVVDKLHIK
jgi:hypothetical protein